ncbi:MAG: FAD-dependent oxidoreductase [Alphaproteobacteria bacterium]
MQNIIVIGAGVIGASIAYNLALKGFRVTVFEQNLPASGATSKTFAWLNANFAETPEYFRLRKAGLAEYETLSERFGTEIGLCRGGSLWWEEEGDALDSHYRGLIGFGYQASILNAAEFSKLEPHVANPPDRCIHVPEELAVNPLLLTGTLLNAAANLGAEILVGCAVTGLIRENDRFTGVDTTIGKKSTDRIVVASGAWTEPLLASAGLKLPMDNKTGLIVHTNPVEPVLNHLVLSPEIHFRQEKDGRIVVGEIFSGGLLDDNGSGADPVNLAGQIVENLRKRLPGVENLSAARIMIGRRPVPKDGYPAIGAPDGGDGLYIATMHSGMTLGPLTGRLVADEIAGTDHSDLLAPYRPIRFS